MDVLILLIAIAALLIGSVYDVLSMEVPICVFAIPMGMIGGIQVITGHPQVLLPMLIVFGIGILCVTFFDFGGADVLAFCIVCLCANWIGVCWVLLFSSVIALVFVALAHLIRHRPFKQPYPFVPMIFAGFVLYELLLLASI